jgi:hypothetical protein
MLVRALGRSVAHAGVVSSACRSFRRIQTSRLEHDGNAEIGIEGSKAVFIS